MCHGGRSGRARNTPTTPFLSVGEEVTMVWIAAWIGVLLAGPLEGTWKVREPLQFEAFGELCEVRRGVAYLRQDGTGVSGSYEAEFSCWSPFAPDPVWEQRTGQLTGTVEDGRLTAKVMVGDPFPVELEARLEGERLTGTFKLGPAVVGEWSAARLPSHGARTRATARATRRASAPPEPGTGIRRNR